jgi:hypothetical protein
MGEAVHETISHRRELWGIMHRLARRGERKIVQMFHAAVQLFLQRLWVMFRGSGLGWSGLDPVSVSVRLGDVWCFPTWWRAFLGRAEMQ